jgi:apolipoprotein N-acyltransferase
MLRAQWPWWLWCAAAGGLQALALAWPSGADWAEPQPVAQVLAMAALVWAVGCAPRWADAAARAALFSVAWLAGTFWWLVVSMHVYGGLPAPLAVAAVLGLAACLALYTTGAAVLWWAWLQRLGLGLRAVLLWAALWSAAELLRGSWFTGFPWGAVGYAHGGLWAGWAPWLGVYGVGGLAAAVAALWAVALLHCGQQRRACWGWLAAALALPVAIGALSGPLHHMALSRTAAHGELQVRLLQGNIAQDQKFDPGTGVDTALRWYPEQLAEALAPGASQPDLVVMPETALPLLPHQVDDAWWQSLLQTVAESRVDGGAGGALLMGLPLGSFEAGYTNSAWGLAPQHAERALDQAAASSAREAVLAAPFYRYDKHHLVPFGEFIPPLFRWFTDLMHIPLGDFQRGALVQPVWHWAGQRVAAHICYEDLFGEELVAQFAQAHPPTVLINLSNIAWFGNTLAIDQHLHIARWRALELGRPVVRSTNTGATVVIDHRGQVQAALARHTRGVLDAAVQGRQGLTPYAQWAGRWGLWPLWAAIALVCLLCAAALLSTQSRNVP